VTNSLKELKVAVTGASGHIGNYLCKELTKKGANLRVLQHNNEDDFPKLGASVIRGNILDKESLSKLFDGADLVYHLAALISIDKKDRSKVFETNVTGTKNVIEVCKSQKVKKLIHFSSIHTIKVLNPHSELNENDPLNLNSKSAYEASKAQAETLIMEAVESGLDCTILSPTAVIGPYDYRPSYLGQAVYKMSKKQLPMLTSGGYDFVDMRDVVHAAIEAATLGKKGEKYILSGKWLSLKSLARIIGYVTGEKTHKLIVPTALAKTGLPFIQLWAKLTGQHPLYTAESLDILKKSSRNISSTKAKGELNYKPRPIQKTLADTLTWFDQHKNK
jgi:dihydroflavonol-4-reductase